MADETARAGPGMAGPAPRRRGGPPDTVSGGDRAHPDTASAGRRAPPHQDRHRVLPLVGRSGLAPGRGPQCPPRAAPGGYTHPSPDLHRAWPGRAGCAI